MCGVSDGQIIRQYPGIKLLGSHESGGDGIINTGTLLLKCNDTWTRDLLTQWWHHPDATTGSTDQYVLAKLIAKETTDSIQVLPMHVMNTDPHWWNTFIAGVSPVLHLMVRRKRPSIPPSKFVPLLEHCKSCEGRHWCRGINTRLQ